jgi:hypothetical protein
MELEVEPERIRGQKCDVTVNWCFFLYLFTSLMAITPKTPWLIPRKRHHGHNKGASTWGA